MKKLEVYVDDELILVEEDKLTKLENGDCVRYYDSDLNPDYEKEKIRGTEVTKNNLMNLCDSKQSELQQIVLGYKYTSKQLERYKDKYERALKDEFDAELNALIIKNHEEYLTTIRKHIDIIETFRSDVDDLIIEEKLDRANELIELGKQFDSTTTIADIKGLFV